MTTENSRCFRDLTRLKIGTRQLDGCIHRDVVSPAELVDKHFESMFIALTGFQEARALVVVVSAFVRDQSRS